MIDAGRFFSEEQKRRIERAVTAAEQRTSGEIVPMIVGASAPYAEVDLLGVIAGLIAGTAIALFWHDPWGRVEIALVLPLLGAVAGLALCRVPAIKRRLLPQARVAEAVHLRSLAEFTDNGLHHTRDHTGILILASLLEHRVEVLADRGINEKVPPGTWDEVVAILTSGLKSGDACSGFCKAIEKCGDILAEHFPRAADDRDELADKLITES
ncbi:MAG TPA: hypothetical protein VNL14_01760 [Candidatus Acidoferrales bacterium]|nr:hypothetical protein [Candidatus Acidoferrales bacterium]